MTAIKERIESLRKIMTREGIDAYIISGTDPHNSEYLPAAWQQREWISGFTGSFGTVIVTKDKSGLWTDTRYFIQAEKELAGTGINLHKLRIPNAVDYPEWLLSQLDNDMKVGFDGFCMTVNTIERLKQTLLAKNITTIDTNDLLGEIWLDRPALPETPLFVLPEDITGRTTIEKIEQVRSLLHQNKADYILFNSLDEIAWLYNIRCSDISYNPVAIGYAIVSTKKAYLFVKTSKVTLDIEKQLKSNGIELRDYHHLFLFFDEIKKEHTFCVDADTLNFAVYHKISSKYTILAQHSPIILEKAVKNQTEIDGFKLATLKDGVAMTRFFYWLENTLSSKGAVSEIEAADKLTDFRKMNDGYISDSFHTISAYGENAALPHYSAVSGKESLLQPRGLYLVDSGGQYIHGTTDITRTIPLGALTAMEREDYTLVLKGMIALSCCIFPKGSCGGNIDIVARQALWQKMMNYGHGTGHGIGHFLCVHEGPQDIRQNLKDQELIPGMVVSDEPGIYREGLHGIRHENMLVCTSLGSNEFGEWNGFETLTLCYFDTSALQIDLLNHDEKLWLNRYHRTVFDKISPFLSVEESAWLKQKTKEI